ncbi:MAG: hypothetical protein ACN4GT_05665 [Gammaproteobacteria bacterium]
MTNTTSALRPPPFSRISNDARHIGTIALLVCASVAADNSVATPETYVTGSYALADDTGLEGNVDANLGTKETHLTIGLFGFGPDAGRLDLGLDYQYNRYSYEGLDSRNRDQHRLQVPLGLRAASGKWFVDAFIAPGVATSSNVFKDIPSQSSSEDFFATAQIEAGRSSGAATTWLIGAAWDRSFGKARVYPVAGLRYEPSERLIARIAFPDSDVKWQITNRQTVTLRLYPSGFEWHVLDDDLVTEFDYGVEAWRAEAWWSLEVMHNVLVDLSLAWEFARRHEFTDRAGTRLDIDADDAVFLTVGVRWNDGPLARTNRVTR